jgi:hypothetical protein
MPIHDRRAYDLTGAYNQASHRFARSPPRADYPHRLQSHRWFPIPQRWNSLHERKLSGYFGPLNVPISPFRQIVRENAASDYRFSELVLGIADSVPFRMRVTEVSL